MTHEPSSHNLGSQQKMHAYMMWPSRNTFFCWGHLMTGPVDDMGPNLCAWISMLSPMLLFLQTWGTILFQHSAHFFSFTILSFISSVFWFMITSFTDPGIIPRGPVLDLSQHDLPPATRSRRNSDGLIVTESWCKTCRIYRPPRVTILM